MNQTLMWRDRPVELSFSHRKSIALHVHEGRIEIRAPKQTSLEYARAFLLSKDQWLARTLTKQATLTSDRIDYSRANTIPFMGIDVRLIREPVKAKDSWELTHSGLALHCDDFEDAALVLALLADFYQKQAHFWLKKKTITKAQQAGLFEKLSDIRFRKTKTKWGHCTAQGRIQYNWQIMMAPETVIDYLVCHEVSHLKHLNHSASFWRQVESLHPNYQNDRKWLNENGHRLTLEKR